MARSVRRRKFARRNSLAFRIYFIYKKRDDHERYLASLPPPEEP